MLVGNPANWTFFELVQFFGPRLILSFVCGGLIGLERELKNKAAGIKTNILICLGASLYTTLSLLLTYSVEGGHGDPGRIAAQIVSGIGFLGGGAIIQSKGAIFGLTTAATIWVVAAIGVCIGLGHSDAAVLSTICVILVLVGTTAFEERVLGRASPFTCEVLAEDAAGQVRLAIHEALIQNELTLIDFQIASKGKMSTLTVNYKGHREAHKKFVLGLWNIPGIKEVKQH